LWYFDSEWYLFVRDGVFQCPRRLKVNSFQQYLWAFADADASTNIDPLGLAGRERRVFSILVTSPQRERWKTLKKNTHCVILTMNPWSWEEILAA
jgi:hypothetical protein